MSSVTGMFNVDTEELNGNFAHDRLLIVRMLIREANGAWPGSDEKSRTEAAKLLAKVLHETPPTALWLHRGPSLARQ